MPFHTIRISLKIFNSVQRLGSVLAPVLIHNISRSPPDALSRLFYYLFLGPDSTRPVLFYIVIQLPLSAYLLGLLILAPFKTTPFEVVDSFIS